MAEVIPFGGRLLVSFNMFLMHAIFSKMFIAPKIALMSIVFADNYNIKEESITTIIRKWNFLYIFENFMKIILSIFAGIWSVNNEQKGIIFGLGLYGTILTYTVTWFNEENALPVLDVLTSALKSFADPLLYSLIAKWVPINEQRMLVQFILAGQNLGFYPEYYGYTSGEYHDDEWIHKLYVVTLWSMTWSIMWAVFGSDHPKPCVFVEKRERHYICEKLPFTASYKYMKRIPWMKIFLSVDFYTIIFTHICSAWAYEVAYLNLCTYFIFLHKLDFRDSIANMMGWSHLMSLIIAIVIGFVVNRKPLKKWPTIRIRKLVNCIGMWGGALALILMKVTSSPVLAMIMAKFYVIFTSSIYIGAFINYIDFSPNFAGLLYGIGSAVAYFVTLWVPIVRDAFLKTHDDRNGWNNFMSTAIIANYLGGLIYALYSKCNVQRFNLV
ncbi:hypothetical protein O3M35_001226 [Rhynocoris fuscipes]|uniref:Uncharacterized protein n=1 Tax=Rhynocoris fuscipes TaxID=488301 RepID=A0AAW1DRV5_9HEMI